MFSNLDECLRETVKLGDNSRMNVMGKGNVAMVVNGITQVITGVFYVPDLTNNLLSIGQLTDKGLRIVIERGKCEIYHPQKGLISEIIMSSNRMFKLFARIKKKEQMCFSLTEDSMQLWHRRYGHLSCKGLKTLQQKGMVKGLPLLGAMSRVCEVCLLGK